ncbi:MAG: TetR/AcrR family transcriptional regulator [Reyranella sp.]|nr:MAG: TetR/AcrR family transcriptional regulator [Reyranella sp.]
MSHAKSRPGPATPVRRPKKLPQTSGRTQVARREEAEQRLLDAAIRLIAERGIKGTTLGDVGEAAGYSSGLTAHHYKTKEGLLKAVTAEIHRRFQQTLSEAALPPAGLDRLLAAIDVYLSVNDVRAARALSLIQKEALTQQSEFRGILRKFNRLSVDGIAAQIRTGIEQGEIRQDIDILAEATLTLAALRGARAQWLQDAGKVDLVGVARELKGHIRRSLAVSR